MSLQAPKYPTFALFRVASPCCALARAFSRSFALARLTGREDRCTQLAAPLRRVSVTVGGQAAPVAAAGSRTPGRRSEVLVNPGHPVELPQPHPPLSRGPLEPAGHPLVEGSVVAQDEVLEAVDRKV